ncbi:MAG: Fe-S cluster assembly protein SufD [Oscillatoriales cyanobacterium SM2_2_1]|nr:Fe-S cluster assembly protein SufD [Oscillatoriales cyanobacterium SM2_2_1]
MITMASLQQRGREQLAHLQPPTGQEEEWQYLRPAQMLPSVTTTEGQPLAPHDAPWQPHLIPEAHHGLWVNGRWCCPSALGLEQSGLWFGTLGPHPSEDPLWQRLAGMISQHPATQDYFGYCNLAALGEVAVLYVPKNRAIAQPIQILSYAAAKPQGDCLWVQPRCLVVLEAGSRATLVETWLSEDGAPLWHNGVTEIYLDDGAHLDHVMVQQEGSHTLHFQTTALSQASHSAYRGYGMALGGHIARQTIQVQQGGPATDTALSGLIYGAADQHQELYTTIDLGHPHGTSRHLQKVILGDRAHGVFRGKIQVGQRAQETNAAQLSRTLLRSPKSRIDTQPQLEILADNVKCSHGVTVSQLDADELFYLLSRGIDPPAAARLLSYGFAAEVVTQIPIPSVRSALEAWLMQHTASGL